MSAVSKRLKTVVKDPSQPSLPLFPDLLDQCDTMKRNKNYQRDGHGIWCIADVVRSRGEDISEQHHLSVCYDRKEWFNKEKTGRCWLVELQRYRDYTEEVTTGWDGAGSKHKA